MDLNIEAFRNIRPGAIRLVPPTKRSVPAPHGPKANPLGVVINFARFMGLAYIPERTVDKLRDDSYFRYCFYQLKGVGESFYLESSTAPNRDRLKHLLISPDDHNDRDFFLGAYVYLNNFPGYLPGGGYRVQFGARVAEFPRFGIVFQAVDDMMSAGGRSTALTMLTAARLEAENDGQIFARRAAYSRFSLRAFQQLVSKGLFTPEELWG